MKRNLFSRIATALVALSIALFGGLNTAQAGVISPPFDPANSLPGFTNWAPQSVPHLIADIAGVTTNDVKTAAKWLFEGDSVMAGNCAVNNCTDSRQSSWPYQVATRMDIAGIPTTTDSFWGCSNETTIANCAIFDNRFTYGTGWTIGQGGVGGQWVHFPANTTPAPMSLAFTRPWNQADIYYICNSQVANFIVDRAGTTTTGSTIATTTGGTLTVCKTALTWTGAAVPGALNINASSNAQGQFFILGVAVRDTADPRIEIYNGGFGASTSATWTTASQGNYGAIYEIPVIAPSVTFNAIGVNDWNTSVALATFRTNMTTLQTAAHVTGDNIFIFDVQSNPAAGNASVATQNTYGAVMQSLAAASNEPYIDFQYRWGSWANASARCFMGLTACTDSRHPSAKGYADLASMVMGGISRFSASGNPSPFALQAQRASGSTLSLTTATPANITSLTLAAGNWRCWGVADYVLTGATGTDFKTGISTTSATFGAQDTFQNLPIITTALSDTLGQSVAPVLITSTGATVAYLVGQATFSGGTEAGYGTLNCQRAN